MFKLILALCLIPSFLGAVQLNLYEVKVVVSDKEDDGTVCPSWVQKEIYIVGESPTHAISMFKKGISNKKETVWFDSVKYISEITLKCIQTPTEEYTRLDAYRVTYKTHMDDTKVWSTVFLNYGNLHKTLMCLRKDSGTDYQISVERIGLVEYISRKYLPQVVVKKEIK